MRNSGGSQASAFNPSYYSPIPKFRKLYSYLISLCFKMNHYCLSYLPSLFSSPFITILSVIMSPFSLFFCLTNTSNSLFFSYVHVFFLSAYYHHSTLEDFQLSHIFLDFLLMLPGWELRLREEWESSVTEIPGIKFCKAEMGEKGRKAEVGECGQRPPVSSRGIC